MFIYIVVESHSFVTYIFCVHFDRRNILKKGKYADFFISSGTDTSRIDGFESLTRWKVYNEDFSEVLEPQDYPIAHLIRTQKPFQSRKVGMYDPDDGRRIIFDVRGEALEDENGEFVAGIVTCLDISALTKKMRDQVEQDEQRFELICDTSPQMIWTTSKYFLHFSY